MQAKPHFCIYGRKPVADALREGKRFDKLLILKTASGEDIIELKKNARLADTPVQAVPKEKLDAVLQKYARGREANHQGVIGFLSMIEYQTLDDVIHHVMSKGEAPLILVLDGVTDVGNFGAIARSAECLGAHAIVIPSQGAAQINAEAMKASAGALNNIFVCREKSLLMALKYLKASGLKVYATSVAQSGQVADTDFTLPCVIVLGSEGSGVSRELLQQSDSRIHIPQVGVTESLNVSVSAGIVLYEAMKQRQKANH